MLYCCKEMILSTSYNDPTNIKSCLSNTCVYLDMDKLTRKSRSHWVKAL